MCELCNLKLETKLYYIDDSCTILDCKTCHVPMVVLKNHTMLLSLGDLIHIVKCITEVFGGFVSLRMDQRKIMDHWHAHIILDSHYAY